MLLDIAPGVQMSLGAVAVDSRSDVPYATVQLPDGAQRELKLDVLRPADEERLPPVVHDGAVSPAVVRRSVSPAATPR
ncbi:hypothetical protein [Streptomyces sp. cg40]|uniref:hypothetical protein n=1 Tax=Streptomyces sp. cg40 TaxID=3419764 RepID=UPI003CFCA7A9